MLFREFAFCLFINYITYIRMWVDVHKTTVERNGSLGYHHVVCNRKTKHARQKALLENSRGRFAFKNVKITHTPTIVGKLVEKSGMERFPDMFSRPLEICGQYLLLRTVIIQIKRR